jgi:thioredoxin 1
MSESPPLLVACLCAEWCGSCRDYRAVFDSLATTAPPGTRFRWIDIEDEADLADGIEVENFPSLLIARGDEVLFIGPVTPHANSAVALIERASAGRLEVLHDEAARRLARMIARRAR